jgi:hypothetical protein
MKTAMKELIEYLEKAYYVKEIIDWEEYKVELLEKEKEQIVKAVEDIRGNIVPRMFISENLSGEEYYNQTYNQNK